jgi:D-Tyr-tRNAtyr deacylase
MANTKSKALNMLETSKTLSERASQYYTAIARDIKDSTITVLEKKIEKLKNKVFDLSDFTLEADANAGQRRMSQEDCQSQLQQLLDTQYAIKVLELELKLKTDIYKELFD